MHRVNRLKVISMLLPLQLVALLSCQILIIIINGRVPPSQNVIKKNRVRAAEQTVGISHTRLENFVYKHLDHTFTKRLLVNFACIYLMSTRNPLPLHKRDAMP